MTVATAGRAVFFSGLTVLLGLLGLVLFEFMILRSVGHRGGDRRGPRGRRRRSRCCRRSSRSSGPRIDRARRPRRRPPSRAPTGRGRGSPGGSCATRSPVLVPTLSLLLAPRAARSCTSGSTPRTRRSCRRRCPSREAYDILAREFGEGEFAPLVLAIRTTGDATTARTTSRSSTTTRGGSRPTRGSAAWSSLVDVDPRLTLEQYQLLYGVARRAARPVRGDGPRRDDEGRPDGVHGLHAVRPEPRRGARAGPRAARPDRPARAARRRCRCWSAAARRTSTTSCRRVWSDFPRTALFIVVTTFLVLFALLRSVVLPIKALVMNTLSIVASFGALVWIFQDGNLSALLGFQPLGLRRDHPARDPVLRPVRAVDGLRGVPAHAG